MAVPYIMKMLLSIFALGLVCTFAGCSNNPVNDNLKDASDRPPVPEPTSYTGMVPATSVKMVVQTAPLSDYSPFVIGASSSYPPPGYVADSLYMAYYGAPISEIPTIDPKIQSA